MVGKLRSVAGAAGAFTLTCVASVALADVTVQQRIAVEGAGLMSAGNMSGTTKTAISGQRSRTDSDIQLQSRLVRMLAHRAVGPTAEIVSLDQDKIDRLDMTRKQYTETTFEEMKARLQKALDKSQDAQDRAQESRKPMDDSKCEWLEPKADVKRTGEKTTIAGFEAQRLTIVASQPCKDKETGAICEVALALDEWLAPNFTAREEEEKFHRAYAQKMGLDLSSGRGGPFGGGDINQRAQSMFGRYSGIWSEIAGKMKDVKGYPVKMSFSFAFGGAQCKSAQSQQQQSSDSDDSGGGGGGLAGAVAGKLGGLFNRKKNDAPSDTAAQQSQPATAPVVLPNGLVPIITMSSELLSVSTDSVSPALFEVPADFKKAERQND